MMVLLNFSAAVVPIETLHGFQYCSALGYKNEDIGRAYEANNSKGL